MLRWGCLAIVACGRVDFDPHATDASTRCEIASPFGVPVMVAGLSSAGSDITLRLEANELAGVFWSDRTGDADIFAATRPDLASAFTAAPIAALNSTAVDSDPTVSADGSFIVFSSTRPGGPGGFDMYEAGGGGAPVLLGGLDTVSTEGQPNYSNAESALYFSSDRSGVSRLYRAARMGAASYGTPVELVELASSGEEYDPAPSADGLALYFRSTRAGGPGGGDAYVVTRTALDEPFGPAVLANINSPMIDGPSFLSPDQCRLYFTSDRTGTPKLYVAAR